MSDIAIKIENLKKRYRLGAMGGRTLKADLQSWWARKKGKEDPNLKINQNNDKYGEYFWALNGINLEIFKGDRLGIIGTNGAGKSTLLKILSRVTAPTEGDVWINGRVTSMLEVGTGFHGELTGRENIYMNGAILGMTKKEIDRKIDDIIAFSEMPEYIDTPVKRYSSGMYVRLGFAIAANLESDILIADEVLAVGDMKFQKKALGKMNELSEADGRTVLFVSHQMNAVKALCNKGIVLDKGNIIKYGDIDECISYYQKFVFEFSEKRIFNYFNNEFFDLLNFEIVDINGDNINAPVQNNKKNYVRISFNMKKMHEAFTIGYAVYDFSGTLIYWTYSVDDYSNYNNVHLGKNIIEGEIPEHLLNEGSYSIRLMASIHFQEWLVNPDSDCPSCEYVVIGGLSESPFWTLKRPGICAPILKWKQLV